MDETSHAVLGEVICVLTGLLHVEGTDDESELACKDSCGDC